MGLATWNGDDWSQTACGATLAATRAIGIKCANPGGVCACKQHLRSFSLDDEVPENGVSAREIFTRLQRGVAATGIPHPLHLATSNLGLAGNVTTALVTIDAAEGVPVHLAHAQFFAYGKEGKNGFSAAAALLAEINQNKNVMIGLGQVADQALRLMFAFERRRQCPVGVATACHRA